MADQRERARRSGKKGSLAVGEEADAFQAVLDEHGTTEFVGRSAFEVEARVLAVVPGADGTTSVFLDRTPFYAESGGQVGDTGTLVTAEGVALEVADTLLALPGLHRHVVRPNGSTLLPSQLVTAAIDVERRDAIRRNHTGTHLLHWALREVLGPHVKQQGSLVAPDRLRFDFSHFEQVTPEQIAAIEDLVNGDVLANDPVRHFETTKDEATALGAIAFFGEKYGDVVRVLEAGPHSTELCGGTHVRRTGDIGPVKIITESSIGANLRRIEAVTGTGPIDRLRQEEAELSAAAARIGVPRAELLDGIDKRIEELRELRAEVKALRSKLATGGADDLAAHAVDGVVVARVDGLGRDDLRSLAVAVRDRDGIRAVVLIGAPEGGGVALVAATAAGSGSMPERSSLVPLERSAAAGASTRSSPWRAARTPQPSMLPSSWPARPPASSDLYAGARLGPRLEAHRRGCLRQRGPRGHSDRHHRARPRSSRAPPGHRRAGRGVGGRTAAARPARGTRWLQRHRRASGARRARRARGGGGRSGRGARRADDHTHR
jgi:alanyl-tRNA synthetase